MRIVMLRKQSSLARWAIVLACLLGFGASAIAAELSALYADGQRQDFPVVVYEGVEHLSLKNLERLLLKVDEGARIGSGTRVWHWAHVCGKAEIEMEPFACRFP